MANSSGSRHGLFVSPPVQISAAASLGRDGQTSIPLSPQWLLPKPGENKPGLGSGVSKAAIGLMWEPKISFLPSSSGGKNAVEPGRSSGNLDGFSSSTLWKRNSELVDGLYLPPNDPKKLNRLLRKQIKDTTGKAWFDMPAPTITPELKRDLQLLKLRTVMDPKRHFKKGASGKLPTYFQVGTVIESPTDFYTGRLTKKERKSTFAEELLANDSINAYRKRKVQEIEEKNRPGGNDKWKIKGRNSQKRAKERRH